MDEAVSSATPWSCGLACVESLAHERGVTFNQRTYIDEQRARFPLWQTMPGATRLDLAPLGQQWLLRWEVYDIARELGLAGSLVEFKTRPPVEAHLRRPRHAAFALLRRYAEAGDTSTHAHAVRILSSADGKVVLMNPGRRLPGQVQALKWEAFRGLEPLVFGMGPTF